MKKRAIIYLLVFLVLISAIAITAYSTIPVPGHGGDEVYTTISANPVELQYAISNNLLLGYNLVGGNNPNPVDPGHSSSKIIVSVSGKEETLQEAINSKTLCSNTSSSSYSQLAPIQGHLGNQIVITNASGVEKTLQQIIDNKEFCTCGDGICQNGSAGRPNYGENTSFCPGDCPPRICKQDINSSGSCEGYTGCSGFGVIAHFSCGFGSARNIYDNPVYPYNQFCSNCDPSLPSTACFGCSTNFIKNLSKCGTIATLSEDYLNDYCISRGCNGVQREYYTDTPNNKDYHWYCMYSNITRFSTSYTTLMTNPVFYTWMSNSLDRVNHPPLPPTNGGIDTGWYIRSWGSLKENATINKLCEFFTGQYGMAVLYNQAEITGADYTNDDGNEAFYWNTSISKWQSEFYDDTGAIDITSIYCFNENGILPRGQAYVII